MSNRWSVHFPSENGVSGEFLICDIAVRPIPDRTHNSAPLNCRCGNFAARNSNAAMVVALENESFSTGLSCFSDFDFILIPLFSRPFYVHVNIWQESANGHFAVGEREQS